MMDIGYKLYRINGSTVLVEDALNELSPDASLGISN